MVKRHKNEIAQDSSGDERVAEFERENFKYEESKGDPDKIQTSEQIQQRKFVKIKRRVPKEV